MLLLYFFIAFVGGVVSLFSPCSGALLPTYFSISFKQKNKILFSNIVFALGIFTISYPLILGVSYIFNLTQNFGPIIFQFIGILFFVFAILTFFASVLNTKGIKFKFFDSSNKSNFKLVYFAGIISGLTLTSCIGPILGAIITLSSTINNDFVSFLLILTYIIGMVFPLYLTSSGMFKLEFLKTIFTKGKLFCISILDYKFYLHSTNLFLAIVFLFIGWVYYFHRGSIYSISLINNLTQTKNQFYFQYLLLDFLK